ncbi:MAG: CPBP family intramembrane glutamic endopeptidase [Lacipirellulaceae bacterium]
MSSNPSASHRRADLIALAVAMVLPTAITWAYFFQAETFSAGVQQSVFSTVKTLQFVFPVGWVYLVQKRRRRAALESNEPQQSSGLLQGMAFGVAVAVAGGALYWFVLKDAAFFASAGDEIRAKVKGYGIDAPWKYAILGAFYTICHSFLEEYYWRWFVFRQLKAFVSTNAAILISALGFMAHHVLVLGKFFGFGHWSTWVFSLAVAAGGIAWAWLYEQSGSLKGPWLSHAVVDAGIFAIGYHLVADLIQ